jgi:hypothetical protein
MCRWLYDIPILDLRILIPVQLSAPHTPFPSVGVLVRDVASTVPASETFLPRLTGDVVRLKGFLRGVAMSPTESRRFPMDGEDEGGGYSIVIG